MKTNLSYPVFSTRTWSVVSARRLALSLLALSALFLAANGAHAAVPCVDANNALPAPPSTDWASAAATIQDAVDAAAAGDEIAAGNYAYMADGYAGLQMIEVSKLVLVGSGHDIIWCARSVAVAGNYAYVTVYDTGLHVIDVSNPAHPVRVGGYDIWGAGDVAVAGNYAYVAEGEAGFEVIDLSNPAKPVRVGGYNPSVYVGGVAVAGNYAYVDEGQAGFEVIDVSNPDKPVRVGGYDPSVYVSGVVVAGNYAFVKYIWGADQNASFEVIDVSNPAKPVRVGGCNTSRHAYGVAVAGNYAYVADGTNGLQVIDVRNPANPVRVGGYDASSSADTGAQRVAVAGSYAFVAYNWDADQKAGLEVIDVRNPAHPVRVGGYNTGYSVSDLAVAGNYAYVVVSRVGLIILQFSGGENLRVTVLGWSNNTVRVSVPTTNGKSYGLEYKDSLSEPEWTRLPAVSGTGGKLILTDPAAPGPQRFYRVREE
jgi:hypothetical protein